MPETREVDGRLYNREHAEMIESWVVHVTAMMSMDEIGSVERNADRLRLATQRLGRGAHARYSRLESDDVVGLLVGDLRGALDAYPPRLRGAFANVTRQVIRVAADGPMAVAATMCETIDRLREGWVYD